MVSGAAVACLIHLKGNYRLTSSGNAAIKDVSVPGSLAFYRRHPHCAKSVTSRNRCKFHNMVVNNLLFKLITQSQ